MTASGAPIEPVSRHGRAVLSHPRHDSPWIVVVAATLRHDPVDLPGNLGVLARAVPMISARLGRGMWRHGGVPVVHEVGHEEGDAIEAAIARPFDLTDEAPLRVLVDPGHRRLVLAGHHAAFDGLALVQVLHALAGGPLPRPAPPDPPAPSAGLDGLVERFLRPADRVAPEPGGTSREICLSRPLQIRGPGVSARIAAAATAALGAHNARQGAPWNRVGISIGMSGPDGVGNVASYRRIDADPTSDIQRAVQRAIETKAEPIELRRSPRLAEIFRPALARFGDSFLVSNLGRLELGAVEAIEFYPVARGRSGVAFGAVGLTRGPSTLTLRTLRIDRGDAEQILDETLERITSP